MTTTWQTALALLNPCADAVAWYAQYPTLQIAWDACERGDWMLWYLRRCGVDRGRLVLAACACARLSLAYVRAGEDRPRLAIETAERWARREEGVTLVDVQRAADAAASAAYAADAAASAAYAAAYAADAVADAASAAAAAYAAASAADADAAVDARAPALRRCADVVRQHFPRVEVPR